MRPVLDFDAPEPSFIRPPSPESAPAKTTSAPAATPSAKMTLDLEFSPAAVAEMAIAAGFDVYRPRPSTPLRDVQCSQDFEIPEEGVRELALDAGLALEGGAAPPLLSAIENLSFTALLEIRAVCDRLCTTGGLDDLLKAEVEQRVRFLRSCGG